MPRVTIVTGAPGTGKTTFSKRLAAESVRGIHLVSDVFYGFPAHPIDPTKPESQEHNSAIVCAAGRAAGAFAKLGPFGGHAIDSTSATSDALLVTFLEGRSQGRFRLED